MKRRIPIGIALTFVILAVAATFAVTAAVINGRYNGAIADFSKRSRQYEYLAEVDAVVRNNYYGDIDEDALNVSVASGYVGGLGDGQSFLLSADEYRSYKRYISGHMTGTGLAVYFDEEKSALVVAGVEPGSPAENAGVEADSVIAAVNGVAVTAENETELISLLTDSEKGEVKITYPAETEEEPGVTLTLSCSYTARSVLYFVEKEKYGYVRITDFYGNTADEFADALDFFAENGVVGIVLDLRNLSGYDYAAAAKIIDMMVPVATQGNKAIAIEKNKNGETVNVYSSDSEKITLPMAVLVNDRTSGAAELIAIDLRQFGKGQLYGERTDGNAKSRTVFELTGGSAAVLVTGVVYPYVGETYDGAGAVPENEISMTNNDKNRLAEIAGTDEDPVYLAAIAGLGA